MSINFSDDVNNEIITTAASLPEDSAEGSLRPKNARRIYRSGEGKGESVRVHQRCKMRGESLDHVLLHGPPGLGKTTLAGIIANEMGVNMRITSGPAIEKPGDLVAMLTNLNEGDILFVDDTPAQPCVRGDTLPRDGGLRDRHYPRQGAVCKLYPPRPAALHPDRRDDAVRPAHGAAARPLRRISAP